MRLRTRPPLLTYLLTHMLLLTRGQFQLNFIQVYL